MMALLFIGAALFGLIVGSFLNVVVLRFGTGLSISRGRSRCFSCDHELSWYELVPLVSYIVQMGRCRHCGSRISPQYPLVEALSSLLFVLSMSEILAADASSPRIIVMSLALAVLVSVYVVITAYDLRHKMIPDVFSYSAAAAALAFILVSSPRSIALHIAAGLGSFLFFYAFWLFSRGRWMGLGDGKLALSLGLLLGPGGAVVAILIAFWSGALISIALIARDKIADRKLGVGMKSEIPFAPFIVFGALLVFFLHIDLDTLSALLAIY